MRREAGILLPISSLPGPYGIGCFSRSAYAFVDWLKEAGQSYWQILINRPSTVGTNWRWRVTAEELTDGLKAEILAAAKRYGRMSWQGAEGC